MVTVQVDALDGATATYECHAEDTALDLKVRIAAEAHHPTSRINLLSGNELVRNDVQLAAFGTAGLVHLQMARLHQRIPAGKVENLSRSSASWDAAIDQLLQDLTSAGVEHGQVLWIDLHNKRPTADSVASATFSRDIIGRGPLLIGREARAGKSWEDLYAWADEVACGKDVISITGASSGSRAHSSQGDDKYLCIFFYHGETYPTMTVEHVRSAGGSWNEAAYGVCFALEEEGVQRGQLLSIDAHNDGPNTAAVFTAHYSRDLQGYGSLALSMECSANENSDWKTLEDRIAQQSAGRELISATGSSNCGGRSVMYAFWHTPAEPLECCAVESKAGAWADAAEALVARLSELGIEPQHIVSIDAHNKGFGHSCVLSAYFPSTGREPSPAPRRLAWELQECSASAWSDPCCWARGLAKDKDVVSITGVSGTLATGGQGLSTLVFYSSTDMAKGPPDAVPASDHVVEFVQSSGGTWNSAADQIVDAMNQAKVERGHIISVNACNMSPDTAAEFQTHFCKSRDGGGRPGKVAYRCLNVDAPWDPMHRLVAVMGAGQDVISITGSSNCEGRTVLYVFYWQESADP